MPWEGAEYVLPGDEKAQPEAPGAPSPRLRRAARLPANAEDTGEDPEDHREARPDRWRRSGGQARRPSKRASRAAAKATSEVQQEASGRDEAEDAWQAPTRARSRSMSAARSQGRASVGAGTAGDDKISNYTINFGPQHPAAHGVLRLIMELDGEIVERVDPHIGLLHRGTEKLIEYKTYAQALPYFDRLDYCSPMCMEHSFVLAIEKLMGLEMPLRAQYIRVLMAELTRISNHMLNLGSHIMDVGAMTPNLWLFEVREDTLQFYERASGARMHANYFRAGGVRYDLTEKMLVDLQDWLDNRLQLFEDAISLVADNRIFKQRNVDIGMVSKDDAIAWGFSGPDDPRRRHPVGHPPLAALRSL